MKTQQLARRGVAVMVATVIGWTTWAGVPAARAGSVVLGSAISLARVQNSGSAFWANDFHIRFKADRQTVALPTVPLWTAMTLGDLVPNGYYFSCGALTTPTSMTVSESNGWIDIEWTFPATWIENSIVSMFGFTNLGGVRFNDVQWWWTFNGVDVRQLPEVWQDWYWEGGELVDRIRNGSTESVAMTRTVGSQVPTVTIAQVAAMPTPPNPVLVNPPGNTLPLNPGQTADYRWPWPAGDPAYFMYYQFSDGASSIRFTNAVNLVPEVSSTLLALAGLACCGMRRRRNG